MKRKYSAILGNLGNTCDRFCSSYKSHPAKEDMLKAAAGITDIRGIELVGTWDVAPENASRMKVILSDMNLECVSIIPDLFTEKKWSRGTLSAKDPATRGMAMEYLGGMCEVALDLGCKTMNLWPGQDGYDYLFQSDYQRQRALFTENISDLAGRYPQIRFALEYKPREPRTHSLLSTMADTLLLCLATGRENIGVCLDTGHAFAAGENVGESIALAKAYGDRLFHMHFNDNFKAWDDDMIVGSVHTLEYLEILYWLDACGYDGWLSMDQYPYREDAREAISESILWIKGLDEKLRGYREDIRKIIESGEAVEASRLMRRVLLSS